MLLRNDPAYWAPSRYLFAVSRVIAWLRSRDREQLPRSAVTYTFDKHQNPIESNVVSSIVFVLMMVTLVGYAGEVDSTLLRVLGVLASPAMVGLILTLQIVGVALIVWFIRRIGFLRTVPDRNLQQPAQIVILTVEAAALLASASLAARVCGAIWLAIVAINLLAHIPLALFSRQIEETDRRLRCAYGN
jgi:hypothetical protein